MRNFHGGSLMIWEVFPENEIGAICENARRSIEVVGKNELYSNRTISCPCFQTLPQMLSRNIHPFMERLARSSDMNAIGNLWDIMGRKECANGYQFLNVGSLKQEIKHCWKEIPNTTI